MLADEGIAFKVEKYIALGGLGEAREAKARLDRQQLELAGARSARSEVSLVMTTDPFAIQKN